MFYLYSSPGLQEASGGEQSPHPLRDQGVHLVPQGPGDPTMSPPVQDRPGGSHQELGRGGEDRRRLRGLLLQGRRPGDLLGLHQQLLPGYGVRKTSELLKSLNISFEKGILP